MSCFALWRRARHRRLQARERAQAVGPRRHFGASDGHHLDHHFASGGGLLADCEEHMMTRGPSLASAETRS
jgi:hypothetical protein